LEGLLFTVGGTAAGGGMGITVSWESEFWSWLEELSNLVSDAADEAT